MRAIRPLLLLLLVPLSSMAQVSGAKPTASEPSLPVLDHKACPIERCTFGKWLGARDTSIFSTWKGASGLTHNCVRRDPVSV